MILEIPWLSEYTNLCQPFHITTQERGKCMDVLEEMGEEDFPTLPSLEEGEEPEAAVFSMSPLSSGTIWAFGSKSGSRVVPALDSCVESGGESDDEDGDEYADAESGGGGETLLPYYPLEMRAAMAHQEAGSKEVLCPSYGIAPAPPAPGSLKDQFQADLRTYFPGKVLIDSGAEPNVVSGNFPIESVAKSEFFDYESGMREVRENPKSVNSRPLPKLRPGKKMKSGVFSVGGGTTGAAKSQVAEI